MAVSLFPNENIDRGKVYGQDGSSNAQFSIVNILVFLAVIMPRKMVLLMQNEAKHREKKLNTETSFHQRLKLKEME